MSTKLTPRVLCARVRGGRAAAKLLKAKGRTISGFSKKAKEKA